MPQEKPRQKPRKRKPSKLKSKQRRTRVVEGILSTRANADTPKTGHKPKKNHPDLPSGTHTPLIVNMRNASALWVCPYCKTENLVVDDAKYVKCIKCGRMIERPKDSVFKKLEFTQMTPSTLQLRY